MTQSGAPAYPSLKDQLRATRNQLKAYQAEQVLERYPATLLAMELMPVVFERGHHAVTVRSCDLYVRTVVGRPWFIATYREPEGFRVVTGTRHADWREAEREIRVHWQARETPQVAERVLLHELAHAVTPADTADGGHGHRWRVNFVAIVRDVMGHHKAQVLRQAFRDIGLPTHN